MICNTNTHPWFPLSFLPVSFPTPLDFPACQCQLTLYSVSLTTPRRRWLICAMYPTRWAGLRKISAVRATGGEVRPASGQPKRAVVRQSAVPQWQRAPPSGHAGERRAAAKGQWHSTELDTVLGLIWYAERGRQCCHSFKITMAAFLKRTCGGMFVLRQRQSEVIL